LPRSFSGLTLVYQFEKSLREVHEYQADQGVTSTYSKKRISGLLLQLITKGPWLALF